MVILNYNHEDITNTAPHSIHLHGHGFAVMSVGHQPQNVHNVFNPDIVCDSLWCAAASWNKSRDVYAMQFYNFFQRELIM